MVYLTKTAKQASANIWHMLSDDPLLRPLGRACDGTINKALAARNLKRADLFTRGNTLAPHRHRLAEMLAVYHFSAPQIVARHWSELKLADHRCAYCSDKKRCDRWLHGRRTGDSPKRFCPNVTTFERWRGEYLQYDCAGGRIDGDTILENGLAQTRDMLRQHRLQESPASNR